MSKSKKICIVVTLPAWGGAQKYVYDLSLGCKERNVDFTVYAGHDENTKMVDKLAKEKIKCKQFKYLTRNISPIKDLKCLFEMYLVFKKNKFDVIHLNSSKAGVIGAISAKMAGCKKVVYTAHGFVFNEDISFVKKIVFLFLEWLSFLFTDVIISVSEYDKNSAIDSGIVSKNKIIVIYNGVKESSIDLLPKHEAKDFISKIVDQKISVDTKIIGCISNHYINKGIVYFIKSASLILKRTNRDLIFINIGSGPEKECIEKAINDEGISDKFKLLGFVDNPEKYLRAFDIYVSPSVKEGLPYSLINASFARVPVVATRVGGCSEIIEENVNGLLVPAKDPEKMSEKLIELINNESLLEKLGKHSIFNKEKFSENTMFNDLLKIYGL